MQFQRMEGRTFCLIFLDSGLQMTLQYPRDERRALNCSTVQRAPFITADFKNFRRETMEGEMDGDGNRGGDNNRRQRRWRAVVIRRRSSQMSKQREFPLPFCMVSHLWHGVRRVEQTFCHNPTFHFHLLTRVMLQILKTRVK